MWNFGWWSDAFGFPFLFGDFLQLPGLVSWFGVFLESFWESGSEAEYPLEGGELFDTGFDTDVWFDVLDGLEESVSAVEAHGDAVLFWFAADVPQREVVEGLGGFPAGLAWSFAPEVESGLEPWGIEVGEIAFLEEDFEGGGTSPSAFEGYWFGGCHGIGSRGRVG